MSDELNREIEAKRQELGAVPLEAVLEALLRDAAATWQALMLRRIRGGDFFEYHGVAYDDYSECRDDRLHPGSGFQRNPNRFFDHVMAMKSNTLTAEMVRRLCVIAGKIPPLIHKVAESGIGADSKNCWLLLWLDATGVTAPNIARTLQPKRPPKRDRIWKLRKKIYQQLAATLASAQEHRAAA